MPRSRTNPQFNADALPQSLKSAGIDWQHMAGLGGLRKPKHDSINAGWRNDSFRGYADYMQTEAFQVNLEELIAEAEQESIAIMCAESVPWRCHRSLVADALVARGLEVKHIMSETKANPHKLHSFARIVGNHLIYPAENAS